MFKIEHLMSNNFSEYPEEIQEYLTKFAEKLRNYIKDELIKDNTDKLLCAFENNKDEFLDTISSFLENGYKGYNNMSNRTLIELYLENKKEEAFINLIEKVSMEMEQ